MHAIKSDEMDPRWMVALCQKSLNKICEGGKAKAIQVTDDRNGVSWLIGVSDFAKMIQSISQDLFETKVGQCGVSIVKNYRYSPIADVFISLVKHAPHYVKKAFPYHSFAPEVDLFFQRLAGRNGVTEIVHALGLKFNTHLAVELCEDLNGFIRDFRDTIVSEDFKPIVRRRKRTAHKNYQTLTSLVNEVFAFYSRVLIVRLDLYYPSDFAGTEITGTTVAPERVAEDRAVFVRTLEQSPISKHLLDFAWKMEFSERKGFHFHWIFFFDGAKVRQDISLGRRLGELWDQIIGHRNGYWNCNAEKHKYDQSGLGMVSRRDTKLLSGLDRANNYLTKPDYFIALSGQKVGDTFGTWFNGKKLRGQKKKRQASVTKACF